MITDSKNRLRVQRSVDALQPIADEYQDIINSITTSGKTNLPQTIGHLLNLSRTTDTLEDIISKLHALLDHPPSVGGAGPLRPLPRPVRTVDRIYEPGVAVPAASDGGPTVA